MTPRALLAKLVTLAASGRPKLIVIDIDLGWSGRDGEEAKLRDALGAIAAKGKPATLIVRQPFGRADGPPLEEHKPGPPDVLRRTPYDTLVAGSRNIQWVSALGPIDGDGVSRRYFVSVPACRSGETLWLPGVQVAACAALGGAINKLRLATPGSKTCRADGTPMAGARDASRFPCSGYAWPTAETGATSEIAYSMSWIPPEGRRRPLVGEPAVEEVEIIDALDLANHSDALDVSAQFKDRTVIFGSSAEHLADLHRTSIGMMPGMLVVANAIRSASEIGPARRSDFWLGAVTVVLMSLATFLLWVAIRRVRGFGHLIFKEAAAPLLSIFWMFAIAIALPEAPVLDFLFPQVILSLYLVVAYAVREARAEAHPPGPVNADGA